MGRRESYYIKIDINRLSDEELTALSSMLFRHGQLMESIKVHEHLAFIRGYMGDKEAQEYADYIRKIAEKE